MKEVTFDSCLPHNPSLRALFATLALAGSAREQSPRGPGDCFVAHFVCSSQ
jgi:hypothetical protein